MPVDRLGSDSRESVCATPFDIAICLLPADTHRAVRSLVPSIPSKANRRISVCCPSIASGRLCWILYVRHHLTLPSVFSQLILIVLYEISFRHFRPNPIAEFRYCHSITSALILVNFACATPSDNAIRLLLTNTNRSVRNSVPSIPSESSSRISVCCLSNASAPILMNFVCANQCDPISNCYSPSRS